MPREVTVHLGERSYEIRIGRGRLAELGDWAISLGLGRQGLIVSDSNVAPLYGARCAQALRGRGFAVEQVVVPAGESSKDHAHLLKLYEAALRAGLDRQSFVVALGGGVVGDLAGYLAATLFRGVRWIQVPTSLLAMVDSSVGGKTGVNLPQGKNLVGAFYQPAAVLADLETLRTLPRREYAAGLAEVVKYGLIWDAELFARLEAQVEALRALDLDLLEEVVARCCRIKADVVEADEREAGLRAVLNFGHTLGHALEQATAYERYLHGEAVAVGMAFALRVSARQEGLPREEAERAIALLRKLGLPVSAPEVAWERVREGLRVDKKRRGGALRWVLAKAIGSVTIGREVPEETLEEVWKGLA